MPVLDKPLVKGLNFNGNTELTDQSLNILVQFAIEFQSIKVLSIERFQVSHSGITNLFIQLPNTRIVELNISGIPLNYFCVDSLCNVLSRQRDIIELRVLHLRNTKLQDLSALRLMEHILGVNQEPVKIKFLSMSMNT